MYFKIKRTVIETYYVEANSRQEALDSGFCDPMKIVVVKETCKKVLNEGILESEKSVCNAYDNGFYAEHGIDLCVNCGQREAMHYN